MKKLLLFFILILFNLSSLEAQSIGFLGDYSGWGDDVDMVVSSYPTYIKTGYFLPNTGLKFRQDDSWTNNWGGDTFPTGTYSSNNIPVTAGFYDISIDIGSTAYSFTSVAGSDQMVSIIGDFTGWTADVMLSTSDFITYTATNVTLTTGGLKFRRDNSWAVNYGGTTLVGTAVPGSSDNIPIPSDGDYDISFNIETFAYSVTSSTLGLEDENHQDLDLAYFKNKLRVRGYNGIANLAIFDPIGREVKRVNNLQVQDNLVYEINLPEDQLFLLQFDTGSTVKTIKIITQ